MTGTGRRWWLTGVGVLVVVVVALAAWLVLRDGDGNAGIDTTPITELQAVTWLADATLHVDPARRTDPAAIGTRLGEVALVLADPQDASTFEAKYGIGPKDASSQFGQWLGTLQSDVSPPSLCGDRARSAAAADTRFTLELAVTTLAALRPTADQRDLVASLLTPQADPDRAEEVADLVLAGDLDAAAIAADDGLDGQAAPVIVGGLIGHLSGVLAVDDTADYGTDFLTSYQFARSIGEIGSGCDE